MLFYGFKFSHYQTKRFDPLGTHNRYTGCSEVGMAIGGRRFYAPQFACFVLFLLAGMPVPAQTNPNPQNQHAQNQEPARKRQNAPAAAADYSGMYSFLRDGEFLQLTVEDQGHVIGFVSRYAGAESDDGFVDHYLKSGKLDGNQLDFTSETVRGVWFEFRGTVERGEGKSRSDEAYYVLKGTLVENTTDEAKKKTSHAREVMLKSFPQDLTPPPQPGKK